MKKLILSLFILLTLQTNEVLAQSNELGMSINTLHLDQPQPQFYYIRDINDQWKFRAFLGLNIDTDREVRADTLTLDEGVINYFLSAGLERRLMIKEHSDWEMYVGSDLYLNSFLRKAPEDDYYAYYYSFGAIPFLGVRYALTERLNVSLETRSILDLNYQSYESSDGTVNFDNRISFNSFDQLVFKLGYRF